MQKDKEFKNRHEIFSQWYYYNIYVIMSIHENTKSPKIKNTILNYILKLEL